MHVSPEARKGRAAGQQGPMRVLDLTWHVAGPYGSKLLADLGADVLKVERPTVGDPSRANGPFPLDEPHTERSGMFQRLNAGKRSITLNLKSPEGKLVIQELALWADVVIESFSPSVLPRLGLDWAALVNANPNLLVCSISNYGASGPKRDWRATPFTIGAGAGLIRPPGKEAVGHGPAIHAAEYAAGASAAALIRQAWEGGLRGTHIDVSIADAAASAASAPEGGPTTRPGLSPKPAPRLGQHNREVFAGMLGLSPGEMVFLRQTGAV